MRRIGMWLQKLKLLDLMAREVRLNVDGQQIVRTWFGFSFSFLYVGVIIAAAVFIFQNYARNDNPTTYTETLVGTVAPGMNLFTAANLPFIYAFDKEKPIAADQLKNYFTINFYVLIQKTVVNANGTISTETSFLEYSDVPCSQLTADQRKGYAYMTESEFTYTRMMQNGICVAANDTLEIVGEKSDLLVKRFYIEMYPCTQGASCANISTMLGTYFYMVTSSPNAVPSSKDNPVIFAPKISIAHFILPNIKQITENRMQLSKIMDYTDKNFVPQWSTRKTYLDDLDFVTAQNVRDTNYVNPKITCVSTNDADCEAYYREIYISTPFVETRYRKYSTILDSFGTIGGISSVLMGVLRLIYSFYEFRVLQSDLVARLFKSKQLNKFHLLHEGESREAREEKEARKSRFRRLNCCRKKTSDEKETEHRRQLALGSINSSMNIVNIVRELQCLRAVCHMIFTPQQLSIIPWLELSENYVKDQENSVIQEIDFNHMLSFVNTMKRKRRESGFEGESPPPFSSSAFKASDIDENVQGFKYPETPSPDFATTKAKADQKFEIKDFTSISFNDLAFKYLGGPARKTNSLFKHSPSRIILPDDPANDMSPQDQPREMTGFRAIPERDSPPLLTDQIPQESRPLKQDDVHLNGGGNSAYQSNLFQLQQVPNSHLSANGTVRPENSGK